MNWPLIKRLTILNRQMLHQYVRDGTICKTDGLHNVLMYIHTHGRVYRTRVRLIERSSMSHSDVEDETIYLLQVYQVRNIFTTRKMHEHFCCNGKSDLKKSLWTQQHNNLNDEKARLSFCLSKYISSSSLTLQKSEFSYTRLLPFDKIFYAKFQFFSKHKKYILLSLNCILNNFSGKCTTFLCDLCTFDNKINKIPRRSRIKNKIR